MGARCADLDLPALALRQNTSGFQNSAFGKDALYSNTTGRKNSAFGKDALRANTAGGYNAALGYRSLGSNTTGTGNVAVGQRAGSLQTSGDNNIYLANNVGVAGENGQIKIGTVGTHNDTFIAGIHGNSSDGGIAVLVNSNGALGTMTSSARFKQDVQLV